MPLKLNKDASKQIASFVLDYGLINSDQLTSANSASEESDKGLIDTILDFGYTTEERITNSLAEAYELELIDLNDESQVDASALSELPKKYIIENRIIPVRSSDNDIHVAISEPNVLNMISSIKLLTNKSVHTYLCKFSEMDAYIDWISADKNAPKFDEIVKSSTTIKNNQSQKTSSSTKERKISKPMTDSEEIIASSEVVNFVDKTLKESVKLGVSDIHIEVFKDSARLRYRIDGVLLDQDKKAKTLYENYPAIVTRIKILSNLDIAERRLPQDGSITLSLPDKDVDFRVSILPTNFGERVVMRILDTSSISLTIETLGFLEEDEENFKNAVDAPQGMVLVTGPTGSGKSTTLYAALQRVNRDDINILTAEDPVEFTLDGVGQVHVKEDIGLTFSAALRSFLRQDPEVVMVGEIRDKETVDIAVKAALTGHLVLSTLHTNDAVSTITRLINMGVEPFLISSALTLVVAQRLARKICSDCIEPDEKVNQTELKSIGLSTEEATRAQLYHGKGCPTCNNTGYKGRQGIYEVLKVNDAIKEGILKNSTTYELLEIAKSNGFSTMQDVGKGMLLQGRISLEEYRRVLLSN